MRCDLCGRTTMVYTGVLNPWYECSGCGALYCDRCSRGEIPDSPGYASSGDIYRLAKMKVCPQCNSPVYKK